MGREGWEELVKEAKKFNTPDILWADAELNALRGEVARLREDLKKTRADMQIGCTMIANYVNCGRYDDAVSVADELRRRAGEGE